MRVSEYNETGHVRDLPQLIQGRRQHGCSFYSNTDGTKVDHRLIIITVYSVVNCHYISDDVGHRGPEWQWFPLLNWAAGGESISLGQHRRAAISSPESMWGQHWQENTDDRYELPTVSRIMKSLYQQIIYKADPLMKSWSLTPSPRSGSWLIGWTKLGSSTLCLWSTLTQNFVFKNYSINITETNVFYHSQSRSIRRL